MLPEFTYAEYVWSSYAIAAGIVFWQAIQPVLKYRLLKQRIEESILIREKREKTKEQETP